MDVSTLAQEWLRLDRDAATHSQVSALLASNSLEALRSLMTPRIAFGTAGLRAAVSAGFARMNALVVIQSSQGLAEHLLATVPSAAQAGVVVGFDGRRDSRRFAALAAAAFAAKGLRVVGYGAPVHTPLVPFGVRASGAAAGVMVTASHNPKDDNGYKVYAANGCQINDPEDRAIAKAISENLEPLTWDVPALSDRREEMAAKYTDAVAGVGTLRKPPRFAYTPLHGVGALYLDLALAKACRGNDYECSVVAEQALPDPEFPTVKYPNPEEDGALDLAKQTADEDGAELLLANDPDADRLAVAEKVNGQWVQFKGDEIGVLLGYYTWEKRCRTHAGAPTIMLTSAVSSQMLGVIGSTEGFEVEETLTGFKWLGNRAQQLGDNAVFAYEEALGYMVPSVVHDKDGIAAAVLLLEALETWRMTLADKLAELRTRYGYFETANTYWKSPSVALTRTTFDAIRADPRKVAAELGAAVQCRVRDLVDGSDTDSPDGKATLPSSPENLMVTLWVSGLPHLGEGARCSIRASGTEPKLKGERHRT